MCMIVGRAERLFHIPEVNMYRQHKLILICLLAALLLLLSGCSMQVDESILDNQANYSVSISLPYATVTPPPASKEEAQPLVIDAAGSVTVNDSASILQGDLSASTDEDSKYKSLRLGNTGLAVQALQTRLQELGYFTNGVSGIFDSATENAVRRFEQSYGTMQTGVATAELQEKLFSSNALIYGSDAYNKAVVAQYKILERGDVGSAVYALQQRLKNLGYPMEELTGIFDNATANAVMLFYEEYGLTASDVANVALQKEIYSDSARPYGGAVLSSLDSSASTAVGASIAQVQKRLIELGYMSGEADGNFDQRTQIAVKLFEEACGQLPSGVLSPTLIERMQSRHAPSFDVLGSQYSNLIEGANGESVRQLQTRLVSLGFATGSPNGDYGATTSASLKLFQSANGMEPNGVASVYVQAVLYSSFALNIDGETTQNAGIVHTVETVSASAVLSAGSSGEAVLQLQNRLAQLGYTVSATGTFDNLTGRAVSHFQSNVGVEPTGTADENLLDFLHSKGAPSSDAPLFDEVQDGARDLAPGDNGEDVKALQSRLRKLRYVTKSQLSGSSGTYNQAMAAAIAEIQARLGYDHPSGNASIELLCYIFSDAGDELKLDD